MKSIDDLDASDKLLADLERSKHKVAQKQLDAAYKAALLRIEEQAEIIGLLTALKQRPPQQAAEAPRRQRSGTASAVLLLSDWHVEERVDAVTCGGLNTYNLQIAEKRAMTVFDKCLMLLEDARHLTKVDELVVALLGDFIHNRIHEEFVETNQLAPMEAASFAADLIERGLKTLLKHAGVKQIVIPTCQGNHGRTTHKMRHSTSAQNSYEYFMYKSLAKRFESCSKIRWQIGEGYHNILNIQGHDFRFHHGEAVKYWGGVGGLGVPLNKSIAAWNKSKPAAFDCLGHFHSWTPAWKFLVNGSLVGMNSFAVAIKADFQPPVQSFMIVDAERGCTRMLPVFCE